MSINATTSSVSATASSTSVTSSQNPETQKSSADSSFKDEMDKVSKSEKEDNKVKDVKDDKVAKDDKTTEKTEIKDSNIDKNTSEKNTEDDPKFAALSMMDVNTLLSNDIEQMINTNQISDKNQFAIGELKNNTKTLSLDFTNSLSMTENDAQFFIDLAQNNTVNAQAVINQAQMALDNGAELSKVQQNVKISETLLNAINTARETNQPLRIDFDQNVSVILRMGKDGSFAANFIPGDKVVEQYLKNNIETLKSTFEEKELPYTDLSYSNRGSKRQKEERNNK